MYWGWALYLVITFFTSMSKKTSAGALLAYYWKITGNYRPLLILNILMVAVASGLGVLLTNVLGGFIDILATNQVYSPEIITQGWQHLYFTIGLMVAVFFLWKTSGFITAEIETKVIKRILDSAFQYLLGHSHNFFANSFAGSLVKRLGRLEGAYETLADMLLFDVINSATALLVITVSVFFFNPWLGVVVMLMIVCSVWLHVWFGRLKYQKFDLPMAEMDSACGAAQADAISNVAAIKSFGAEEFEVKKFAKVTDKFSKQLFKTWTYGMTFDAILDFVIQLFRVTLLVVSFKFVIDGQITAANFVVIQVFMFRAWDILFFLSRIFRRYYKSVADASEMLEILQKEYEIKDAPNAAVWPIKRGEIEFKNVSFRYQKNADLVLDQFSLRIKSGEKVALVGPSGGGKSTILKLLTRFYDVTDGAILIDGKDIREYQQSNLRAQLSLVPQEPVLFHRTLMDNIRYGREGASDEEVIAAAKMAYCHDFIMTFEKGYDTFVGERGVKLSGGQRQRVAIARAILSNSKILLLDEATSSLDSESEQFIQKALDNLIKQKTASLVIAHRLSTVMNSDRIVVAKDGGIVEQGSHADLRNSKGGLYGKLWDTQVGKFWGSIYFVGIRRITPSSRMCA